MKYDYLCEKCSAEFEIEQRITDPIETKCLQCGETTTHRLISGNPNFLLKGGMWASSGYSSAIREQIRNLPQEDED
jgi:putative FmdB family regulatory protein